MASHAIDSFINTYVQALHNQNAAIFAGAGLSIPAGLVNWKELLRDIANDIGLNIDKEDDLVTVAQFHVNERGGRHKINQALVNEFANRAVLTENHKILASLPIRTYWTTNYDTLIEDALRSARKNPDIKITKNNLSTTFPRQDAVVYKMHGDVSQPDEAVVTKDDYEAYDSKRHLFSMALQGDLVSKTFLFIGFSFSDPNLSYILRPTVSPRLTPVSSRNALLLQSLPTNTPFWQVNSRRRKDDTRVGTATRGIVERLSRLPRRFP